MGNSEFGQTQVLDFTDIYGELSGDSKDLEQITFWVKGSGVTNQVHNLKVELKDNRNDFEYTAIRYIPIDDSDPTWRKVVLDADVTNSDFWSYNLHAPDPTAMKFLVFVVESSFNESSGTFYIDNIQFVDADDSEFSLGEHTDDEFLDLIGQKTFQYFLDWFDPESCQWHDRSTFPDLYSIASSGFGITALVIGDSRGWIDSPLAKERVKCAMENLVSGQSPTDTPSDLNDRNGFKGFFVHFLDKDGTRKDEGSELSPVDTAILIFGVLAAREYYIDDPEIVDLADTIYRRVEWEFMLDRETNLFFLAYRPECGEGFAVPAPEGGCFSSRTDDSPLHWDYSTDELMLINTLAIGSPTHPVEPDVFYAWQRTSGEYGGHNMIHSFFGSLFTYSFSHLFIDYETLGKDNHPDPSLRVDWLENSVQAAMANRQFAIDHQDSTRGDGDDDYTTYGPNSWGLTAADGPCGEYHSYGALPAALPPTHDGTIAPYGAGMALSFTPSESLDALKNFFSNTDLWRYRFGFGDAFNLDPPICALHWYEHNHALFGIDQGPLLLAIENYRSGLIWDIVGRNSDVRYALNALFSQTPPPTNTTVVFDPTPLQLSPVGTGAVDIVVKDVTDPEGLRSYDFTIFFDPLVVNVSSSSPGNPPFSAPNCNPIPSNTGQVNCTGFQSVIPSLTGDIKIFELGITAVGNPGEMTALTITINDLTDSNGDDIPANRVDGIVNLLGIGANPSLDLHQDLSDGATGVKIDLTRVFDPVSDMDVLVDLGGFQSELSYQGTCINVLDVRAMDFPLTATKINNPGGTTVFNGLEPSGVPWPADLGHALIRLVGSNQVTCTLTNHITSLTEKDGQLIDVPTVLSHDFLRGDARADGTVNIADALFIAQYLVGLRPACTTIVDTTCLHSSNAASVRHDDDFDKITIADALFIAQFLVGLRDASYDLNQSQGGNYIARLRNG